ncbi:MAG: tetratricopeptide repeat protein [Candidatus Neomarinimicrobiota bacterium]
MDLRIKVGRGGSSVLAAAGVVVGVGLLVAAVGGQIRDPYADAVRYFELGRYDQATARLQGILAREPECVECYDLLARVATTQGDDSLAAVWYRQALEVEPENATLYQKLGSAEHRAGYLSQAISDLGYSLELNPTSGEAHFALGNVWYDLDSLEQAKECYSQALALDSTAAKYHYQLGLVYFKTDQPDSALMEFQATYRLYPKYSLAYEFAANILITQGRWREVVAVLEQGLASAPETEVTGYWLGRAQVEVGDYERAAEVLGGYVTRYKEHVGARYNYGLALYEIGDYEEAVEQLSFVTARLPHHLKAQLYLGRSLGALHWDSLAFAVFDTLLSQDSTYYEAWIGRGDIHLARDRYDTALSQYLVASSLEPERWEAYQRRGLTHYVRGEYPQAELLLFSALMREDSAAAVYDLLGDVAAAMVEDDFAAYYYSVVLRLDPENIAVRTKMVEALIRRRLWEAARSQLLWLYKRDPRNEPVLYRLGRVAYAAGDSAAAGQYMREFRERHSRRRERERLELRISQDRRNPRHYRELGWYYRRLEDQVRARAYFRRAVALGDTTLPASLYMEEEEGP